MLQDNVIDRLNNILGQRESPPPGKVASPEKAEQSRKGYIKKSGISHDLGEPKAVGANPFELRMAGSNPAARPN